MNIDYEKLRRDLMNYFGSAIGFFPMAIMEVTRVQNASNSELLQIANQNGFNLSEYEIGKTYRL